MDIDALLGMLQSEDIGMVISVNLDVIRSLSVHYSIELYNVFRFLGVDIVILRNDPQCCVSYGRIFYSAYKASASFVNLGILQEYLNAPTVSSMASKGVPIPLANDYSDSAHLHLKEDYNVVVVSNSRIREVRAWESPINKLLDNLANPLVDLPIWHLSTLSLLGTYELDGMDLDIIQRNLWSIFYSASQFLKHQIIRSLETARKVSVYGDSGWREISKDRYCGNLNQSEIRTLAASDETMFLLMNHGYTYLDHIGPVYDSVQMGASWINVPAIWRPPMLAPLGEIEYTNIQSLNFLINNCHEVLSDKKVVKALSSLSKVYYSGISQTFASLEVLNSGIKDESLFRESYCEHKIGVKKVVDEYILVNKDMLCLLLDDFLSLKVRPSV